MRPTFAITACMLAIGTLTLPAQQPLPPPAVPYTTADTPLSVLVADPAASAILEKYLPGTSKSAQLGPVRSAPLKALQSFAASRLTDQVLADIDAELAKLPPQPWSAAGAGWPINVNESKVVSYTLPDPLLLSNGTPVRDARTWWHKRRPEIVALFESQQFGRAPDRPRDQSFELFDHGTPVFDGKAIRKQVVIHLSKDPAAPTIQLVEYIPAAAKRPVPMWLTIGFAAPSSMIDDPGIRPGMVWDAGKKQKVPAPKSSPTGRLDLLPVLDAGIGVATFYYGDVEPDFPAGYAYGIRAFYAQGASPAPDAWGAIAAWAWALSRVQDYFETDKAVDAKRVAINGASRLGKTVLWAAARDQRFALVTACCSGEGGAALSRRNFGQTIGELNEEAPHQFALNYRNYGGHESALPMDAHMLLALIAPRPVFLQTGRYDHWSDPKGEFAAAVAAGPVYRLLGRQDLGTIAWPPAGPILNDIGFMMDSGGHGMAPGDWQIYIAFLKKHL